MTRPKPGEAVRIPTSHVKVRVFARCQRPLAWTAIACSGALALTGLLLVYGYQPSNALGTTLSRLEFSQVLRTAHRVLALMLTVVLSAAALATTVAVVTSGPAQRIQRGIRALIVASAALLGSLFASFSGYRLPWDQIALQRVTIGADMRGFLPILRGSGETIRFLLRGQHTVDVDTLRRWFWTHLAVAVVSTAIVAAPLIGLRRRSGRIAVGHNPDAPDLSTPEPSLDPIHDECS